MNKRTFNKFCRILFGRRTKRDPELTDEQKHEMLIHVVRNRGPVHPKLVTPILGYDTFFNRAWLNSMGYLYQTKGFLHTCEHVIK